MTIGNDYARVAFPDPQVRVSIDGRPVAVTKVKDLKRAAGTGRTLKWRVALPKGVKRSDSQLEVTISGVEVNRSPEPIAYAINAFRPG